MPRRKKNKKATNTVGKAPPQRHTSPVEEADPRASWFDPRPTRARVEQALLDAGPPHHLLGYEAVEIQDFIAANSRPVALEGASRLIREDFDAKNLEDVRTVFAGGGRGLMVVSKKEVSAVSHELHRRYRQITHGGQLAVADAPLLVEAQRESLRWLRMKLDGAKDRAPAPIAPLPTDFEICADCRVRAVQTDYRGPEHVLIPVCKRCARVVEVGRSGGGARWTFEEISSDGSIALVHADGNNLGALFDDLTTLEEQALCSQIVSELFARAHQAACPRDTPFIAPVVGGDDIRVFLPSQALLPYVTTLARQLHELTAQLEARQLPKRMVQALRGVGVGVGAVVAPYHYPAQRLFHMAHELEDEAKRSCLEHGYRSALSLVCLRSGEELSQGVQTYAKQGGRPNTIELGTDEADRHLARAAALLKVPSSQRAMMISSRDELDDEVEFINLFCYQLARNERWRAWFDTCNVDWRDRRAVAANLPDRHLLDLASLSEVPDAGV